MEIDIVDINNRYPNAYLLFTSESPGSFIEFFDKQGFYITITPEFYKEGINWNLQIFWYKGKDEWPKRPKKNVQDFLIEGTMMYGDNNEFPTRKSAEDAAVVLAFELLERKLTKKKMLPEFLDRLKGDSLNFDVLFDKIKTE